MLWKIQLCWEYFGLFPGSNGDVNGPRCVIKAPLEMDLRGRVGVGINEVSNNTSLNIQNHAMENATVLG